MRLLDDSCETCHRYQWKTFLELRLFKGVNHEQNTPIFSGFMEIYTVRDSWLLPSKLLLTSNFQLVLKVHKLAELLDILLES